MEDALGMTVLMGAILMVPSGAGVGSIGPGAFFDLADPNDGHGHNHPAKQGHYRSLRFQVL